MSSPPQTGPGEGVGNEGDGAYPGDRMRATRLAFRTAIALALLVSADNAARADTKTCIGISEEGQRQRADKKLIAAKDLFDSCSKDACPKIVRDDCVGWAKEVDALLPSVLFVVRDSNGKDLQTASILIDGSSSRIADGTAVPLDPGTHALKVTAGARAQELSLVALEGEKNRRVVVVLEEPPPTKKPNARSPAMAQRAKREGVPVVPLVVGGLSLVVLGIGVFFQVTANSENNKSNDLIPSATKEVTANPSCDVAKPDPSLCPYTYSVRSHHDAAKNDQTFGLPMIGLGGAGVIASGVFLYLLWPRSASSSPKAAGNRPGAWTLVPSFAPANVGLGSTLGLRGAF